MFFAEKFGNKQDRSSIYVFVYGNNYFYIQKKVLQLGKSYNSNWC